MMKHMSTFDTLTILPPMTVHMIKEINWGWRCLTISGHTINTNSAHVNHNCGWFLFKEFFHNQVTCNLMKGWRLCCLGTLLLQMPNCCVHVFLSAFQFSNNLVESHLSYHICKLYTLGLLSLSHCSNRSGALTPLSCFSWIIMFKTVE